MIDRFGDFNDLESEKMKFNKKSKTFSKFKNLSILTYVLLMGALRSVFIVKQFTVFYIIVALIGGILLVKKNKSITNKKYKKIVQITDASIIILLIVFYKYFSISLQIKDIIGLLIIILYMIMYFKLLFDRKLI